MKNNALGLIVGVALVLVLGYAIIDRLTGDGSFLGTDHRMQVVASFYPLAHIAEQIGKDNVRVLNLTPAGSEPHDFDPSPRDVATLQRSSVFLYNGAGLESWVTKLIPDLEKKRVRIVEATNGLDLLPGIADDHEEGHDQEHEGHGHDPHVWLDPILLQAQVNMIAQVFADADSSHADSYKKNAESYAQELQGLDVEFAKGLAQCKRRDIVTSHAAFAYLAKRYGLNMVPIAGLSPEEEPSPARLGEISKFVKSNGVTHIFFETLVSPKLAETIAKETGAQTIAFNPLEGLSDEEIAQGKTYITVQRENLQALRTALDCI